MRPGGHAAVHRPLADQGRDRAEQEVEGVHTRRPHAMPPGGLPLHAGEVPELAAHLSLGSTKQEVLGSFCSAQLKLKKKTNKQKKKALWRQ